jgi:isoleucyl-tRNA synthetase
MRYIGDWEKMTERMGFWVNLDEAYYTLDNSYIESVWYLLKTIWDKGLIYRGYKVVPYDPRIGATLSSHEVALGYREVDDPSIYVRFKVEGEDNTSSSGPLRRGPCLRTCCWRCIRTSTTSMLRPKMKP